MYGEFTVRSNQRKCGFLEGRKGVRKGRFQETRTKSSEGRLFSRTFSQRRQDKYKGIRSPIAVSLPTLGSWISFPLNRSLALLTTLVYINFFTYRLLKVPSSPNLIMQVALIWPLSFLTLPCKSGVTSVTVTRPGTPFPAYVAISESSRDGSH